MTPYARLAIVAGLSGTVAATVGYILGVQHMEREMDRVVQKEVNDAKEFYKKVYKAEEYSSPEALGKPIWDEAKDIPEEVMQTAVEALQSYQGIKPTVPVPPRDVVPIRRNVFKDLDDVIPSEDQQDNDPIEPFVIDVADFMEGEGFEKVTLTWYDGDRTLSDEREEIVVDVDKMIGIENLDRFGESDPADNDTVYIRNTRLGIDYEVLFEPGKYSVEVAGFTDEPEVEKIRPRRRLAQEE